MYTLIQELLYRKFRYLNLNRSTSFRVTVLVFLLTSVVTIAISAKVERQKLAQEQTQIANLAQSYSTKIQTDLEKTLAIAYPLAALVKEYQGTIPNFEAIGQELLSLYPAAYAVALLPNDEDNQIIFAQPHKNLSQKVIDPCKNYQNQVFSLQNSEQPILTDSFSLQKNLTGSAGCLPIFLENQVGKKSFWGFTSVIINYQQLLKHIDTEDLKSRNLAYVLNFIESSNQTKEQIFASSGTQYRDRGAIQQKISLPSGFGELSIFPTYRWNQSRDFLIASLSGILLSLLVATLVKLLLDSKVHADELEKVAYFDPLTSLPNHRLLLYRLDQILYGARRKQTKVAVCYLDLDNFKRINDRLGSKAGDYILVRIAKRLQKFLRADDVIARIDGDEFVIILKEINSREEAELIITRIRETVTTPIVFETEVVAVTTSIGITVYPEDCSSKEILLSHAHQAMLHAKEHRRGDYITYQKSKYLELPS